MSVPELDKVHILDAASVDGESLIDHLAWQEEVRTSLATFIFALCSGQDIGGKEPLVIGLV